MWRDRLLQDPLYAARGQKASRLLSHAADSGILYLGPSAAALPPFVLSFLPHL